MTTKTEKVVELVVKTKVERAAAIFEEVTAESFVVPEGSSPRKVFLDRCISELEMTPKGASTYWQNQRMRLAGKPISSKATGAPRGRPINKDGQVRKAAAKVLRLQGAVTEKMNLLKAAQDDLVLISTGTDLPKPAPHGHVVTS